MIMPIPLTSGKGKGSIADVETVDEEELMLLTSCVVDNLYSTALAANLRYNTFLI